MQKYVMAYDADCGPCTRFKRLVDFLDRYRRIDPISLTRADELGLLDKIPHYLKHKSFHLISPDGYIESGAGALPALISLLPSGGYVSWIITSVAGGKRITNFVYSVFSRLHETGACRYDSSFVKSESFP